MTQFKKIIKTGKNKGQTATEYIILLAAVMAIILPLLGRIREELVPNRNPCPDNDQSIGCGLQRFVGSFGAASNFRYFTLRR